MRVITRLTAPGDMKQEEIGRLFGYDVDVISQILGIEIKMSDKVRENLYIYRFSNMDKLSVSRVIHPKLQLGLMTLTFSSISFTLLDCLFETDCVID